MSNSTASTSSQGEAGGGDTSNNADNLNQQPTPPESRDQYREMLDQDLPTHGQSERLWIRYRTEYRDRFTDDVVWEQASKTPSVEGHDGTDATEDPVFEIITTYRARDDRDTSTRSSKKSPRNQEDKADGPPPRSFGVPASYELRIYSPAIRNALNSVVRYYPSQSLAGDVLEIEWPYPLLVHHYDELAEFRKQVLSKDPNNVCMREKHAPEDIEALLGYLDRTVMDGIRGEISRNERGFSSYEHFWYALKPGTTILTKSQSDNDWKALVVSEVSDGAFVDPPEDWMVTGWSLAFDGLYLDRKERQDGWKKFSGELNFEGSGVKIISDTDNIEDEDAKRLADYGRTYWRLVQKQCQYHVGDSCNFPYNRVEGLVMTDMQQFYNEKRFLKPKFRDTSDIRRWITDCTCTVCKQRSVNLETETESIFGDYTILTPKDNPNLSDHEYLLCPFEISAFVFKTRSWDKFHVKNFTQPSFQRQMINTLVTDEERITTLKALAQSFIRVNKDGDLIERTAWAADFVKGKGTGMTFLLHGKPGVGKTYTAECIAEYTQRPLMTLTSSDIGTDPSEVELNLTRQFITARSWGAVLLIDEADVFMERRSTSDLTRNSLVAGFLRALEFYDGLLFLTTNRVGAFDDAFISRIHIQLYYRDFTDSERQRVWKTFIDKLHDDSTDKESGKLYMRVSLPAQEYIEGEQIRAIRWNGREIRNAFQIAVSLAEHENRRDREGTILLTDRHLKSVLALSKDFKDYLTELHQGDDEARRAQKRKERLDDFGDAS